MFAWIRKLDEAPVTTKYFLNDPCHFLIKDVLLPKMPANLKYIVNNFKGPGFELGTLENQAASCYITMGNSIAYFNKISQTSIKRWSRVDMLKIFPRAGKNFNAIYDRKNLKFFFDQDPKTGKIIYTSESPDVVAHELGHGLLDAVRPDLFNLQSLEIWAFHEAFGDINAMLYALTIDEIIDYMLKETGGDISKSNITTRLAEDMGFAIYNSVRPEEGRNPGFLRNACNSYKYVLPEKLIADAPDNVLCAEPHNFSRIFSGAFYDIIVGIYNREIENKKSAKEAIVIARDVAASYLINALPKVPATVRFFDAMAKTMLAMDKINNSIYQEIIKRVFFKRGILKPIIKLLNNLSIDDIKIHETDEVFNYNNGCIIRNKNIQTINLSNSGNGKISALSDNPLRNLKLEVPADTYYEFNQDGILINEIKASVEDVVYAAETCLKNLHLRNEVSSTSDTPFEVKNGKLIRSHFACFCGCGL